MKFFGSFGVGGKGMFESRPHDQFGWGFYYINIDNPRLDVDAPRLQGLPQNIEFLRNEYGFEAYYNFAITPWALLTPDIQIVRGAQKDTFTIGQGPPGGAAPHRQEEHKHIDDPGSAAAVAVLMRGTREECRGSRDK